MESRRVKALVICPTDSLSAGGEKSNFELIKYLARNNTDLAVVTPGKDQYSDVLRQHEIENYSAGYVWWANWVDDTEITIKGLGSIEKLSAIVDRFQPDVVITNTFNVPWGAIVAAARNIPHIWIGREFPDGEFGYLAKKMTFIDKFSNQIMVNSRQLSEYISSKHSISTKYFYSYVDTTGLSLGHRGKRTRIVSINSISRRKNQEELIKAAVVLKNKNIYITKILLIGVANDEYKEHLMDIIRRNDLEGIVDILPFNPNPWLLVGKNDILVQTSLSESIGRTTTEAMKLGVPVIASDIPGHKEAFELGGGTLYRSGSPSDLADKIELALAGKGQTATETLAIKKRSIKNMSEEACSGPFYKAMSSIVGEDNPMKDLGLIGTYLEEHVKYSNRCREDYIDMRQVAEKNRTEIVRQQDEISLLKSELDSIIKSRRYRLGSLQIDLINKVIKVIRGGK